MKRLLLSTCFGAVLSAWVLPASAVTTLVKDVENPVRTPVWITGSATCTSPFVGCFGNPIYQVPVDKRLVIQFLSASCSSAAADTLTRLGIAVSNSTAGGGATQREFHIPMVSQGLDAFGNRIWAAAMPTTLYADHTIFGSQDVALGIGRSSGAASISCTLTLSGYLARAYPVQ